MAWDRDAFLALGRFVWRKRAGKLVPDGRFLGRPWDASREGAMLQLRIYRKMTVAPSARVRVKYSQFANIGLTVARMLRIARAEGCRFDEAAFLRAVGRFRRSGGFWRRPRATGRRRPRPDGPRRRRTGRPR